MITEDDVLRAVVENMTSDKYTRYEKITSALSMDDVSLLPFLKSLENKGYIIVTMENLEVTQLGIYAYNEIKPIKKVKKSIYALSKFTLQRFADIFIGVIIGLIVAYVTYHFGWK